MIEKSLIIIAVISSVFGINYSEDRFDDAIYKLNVKNDSEAIASDYNSYLPNIIKTPEIKSNATRLNIYAYHYLLADLESGKHLVKREETKRVPIASTTKIMTALVSLEKYDLDEIVEISSDAAYQIGADAYLRVGEKITVRELLHCLLIKSGNDAAYALAEHANNKDDTGVDKFVGLMNQKAEELGMKDTKYRDPAGLDASGYSTASDLLIVTREAMNDKTFSSIVSKDKYVATSVDKSYYHQLDNSNRLVGEYSYPGAIGVKTGYTPEAGHCLVSAATRNGHTLIGVVLYTYADTVTASADESKKLLDWGFNNTIWFN